MNGSFLWVLVDFIVIPWSLINTCRFYRYCRFESIRSSISKRVFPRSQLWILNACMFVRLLLSVSNIYHLHSSGWRYVHQASSALYALLTIALFFVLNTSSWLVYYQYWWTYHTLEAQWTHIVNPGLATDDTRINWFVKHKQTRGTDAYVLKISGGVHTVLGAVCALCMWALASAAEITAAIACACVVYCIVLAALLSFFVYFLLKTPAFNDVYLYHYEYMTIAKILLVCVAIIAITAALRLLVYAAWPHSDGRIFAFLMTNEQPLMFFALHFFCSVLIPTKIRQHLKTSFDDDGDEFSRLKSLNDHGAAIELEQVLSDAHNINVFMRYLSREFSNENLLSFIEFIFFKQHCMKLFPKVLRPNKPHEPYLWQAIPSPEPAIVEQHHSDDALIDVKTKAHLLFEKYVKNMAELEINISHSQRSDIEDVLQNLDALLKNKNIGASEIFEVFDVAMGEIYNLMKISLTRFRYEPEFIEVTIPTIASGPKTIIHQKNVVLHRMSVV